MAIHQTIYAYRLKHTIGLKEGEYLFLVDGEWIEAYFTPNHDGSISQACFSYVHLFYHGCDEGSSPFRDPLPTHYIPKGYILAEK